MAARDESLGRFFYAVEDRTMILAKGIYWDNEVAFILLRIRYREVWM